VRERKKFIYDKQIIIDVTNKMNLCGRLPPMLIQMYIILYRHNQIKQSNLINLTFKRQFTKIQKHQEVDKYGWDKVPERNRSTFIFLEIREFFIGLTQYVICRKMLPCQNNNLIRTGVSINFRLVTDGHR